VDAPNSKVLQETLNMLRRERVDAEVQVEVLENMWSGLRGNLQIVEMRIPLHLSAESDGT
jgi:hypothetical protein